MISTILTKWYPRFQIAMLQMLLKLDWWEVYLWNSLAISDAIMARNGEHQVSVIQPYSFFKKCRNYHCKAIVISYFRVVRHGIVHHWKTILLCVGHFRETGSAIKRKSPDRLHSFRTPENIIAVRKAVLRSPQYQTLKHDWAFGMSDQSSKRILHAKLNFHLLE